MCFSASVFSAPLDLRVNSHSVCRDNISIVTEVRGNNELDSDYLALTLRSKGVTTFLSPLDLSLYDARGKSFSDQVSLICDSNGGDNCVTSPSTEIKFDKIAGNGCFKYVISATKRLTKER